MPDESKAPFAFSGLDRIFHERARLGIVTSLAGHGREVAFTDLKRLCGLTDGNLSRHLQALDEAGLIETMRGPARGRAPTRYKLTASGRERFIAYLDELEVALGEAAKAMQRPDMSAPEAVGA